MDPTKSPEMTIPEAWANLMWVGKPSMTPQQFQEHGEKVRNGLERVGGGFVWVTCPKCREEWTKLRESGICQGCEDRSVAVAEEKARLERVLGRFTAEHFTLAKFLTPTETHEGLKEQALKFRPADDNLFLQGPCGSGKTHLAVALLQEWASALQGSFSFVRSTELVRGLRGLQGHEESAQIKYLAGKRLLVIDDLGVGKGTEFTLAILYEIIEERMNQGHNGLIITSNLKLADIAKKFGDDRLTSRIAGMCEIVNIELSDWRGGAYQGQKEEIP